MVFTYWTLVEKKKQLITLNASSYLRTSVNIGLGRTLCYKTTTSLQNISKNDK